MALIKPVALIEGEARNLLLNISKNLISGKNVDLVTAIYTVNFNDCAANLRRVETA